MLGLLTFYGSVAFVSVWNFKEHKPSLSPTATPAQRLITDEEWKKIRLYAVEDEYLHCIDAGTLPRTKEEAEKVRRLCAEKMDKTFRDILTEKSPR